MKYKEGDKVHIRSKEWYDNNKSYYGDIECGSRMFYREMSYWCGRVVTIKNVNDGYYRIVEDGTAFIWTDEMFEGLVEEERVSNVNSITRDRVDKLVCKIDEELPSGNPYEWECPEGYQFKDENGNVINTTKIVLEKKKPKYPKTYEECYQITGLSKTSDIYGYKNGLLFEFQKLLIARDAYWKIAGDEMGLGKPWEPDGNPVYAITRNDGCIVEIETGGNDEVFEFPTQEMRDAFKENFDPDIEICKELL